MIRSIHIIGSQGGGGAESFYVRLVNALQADTDLDLCAVHPCGSMSCRALTPAVPHVHATMWSVFDLLSQWRIRRLACAATPTVVQTYMGRATRLTHLPRRTGLVHIARLGGFYNVRHYRHAQALVGNTRAICDYLIREGVPAARVFHIGNFVPGSSPLAPSERTALRATWRIPTEALVVTVLARLHKNKGVSELLSAFALLEKQLCERPVRLICVGDGPLRDNLRQQAHALGVADRVIWTGWQSEPHRFLALADLSVCPSRHEPLGNVILEGWSAGCPVLATRTHGGEELITHGQNGWLVPVQNPTALAAGMLALLRDEPLRRALAAGGAATLAQQHSQQAVVKAYHDLYRVVLKWSVSEAEMSPP